MGNNIDLLIISDSHGNRRNVDAIMKRVAPKNTAVLFLGDGVLDYFDHGRCISPVPFYCVRGNCDLFGYSSKEIEGYGEVRDTQVVTFGGYRILMTHGHRFDVKTGLDKLISYANANDIDIVLFGHTHACCEARIDEGETVFFEKIKKPIYLFNPGSLGGGFFSGSSFGTLTISDKGILFGFGKV